MEQSRVEPYVGTSSSWRAASPGSGVPASLGSDQDQDQHTISFGSDAEHTIDIPDQHDGEPPFDDPAFDEYGGTTSDDAMEVQVGTTLRKRYVLHRLIGTGGTCRVFLAEDLHRRLSLDAAGELIALKVLRPGLGRTTHSLQRLRREFLQMQLLTHPSITRVFDLDCDGDVWFMTMELVEAPSALTWMSGDYSNAEALRVILACCEAVSHAHRRGIVHGDLKPGNVLVVAEGGVKLIDFGSVAGPTESACEATKLEATPQYASPSVLAGNMAEVRDDVFGLGCLAYMILARGRHPFDRKPSSEAANAQLRAPYIPGIPLRLFEVIARALAWDPAQRQASVRELQHALLASELARAQQSADAATSTVQRAQAPAEHPPAEAANPKPATSQPAHSSQPAHKEKAANTPGDLSYLSKFRGYVAGPMKDSKLHREAPQEESHEPEPVLPAEAAPAAAVAPQPLYIPTATLAPAMLREPRAREGVAERLPPPPPSRGKRILVNALGLSLVLASAVGAALLSRPEPKREVVAAAPVAPVVSLPALTLAPPELEPLSLPKLRAPSSVRIAASKPEKPAQQQRPAAVAAAKRTRSGPVANVSFDAGAIEVSPNQKLVAIQIRRSNPERGAARVAWQIEGGRGRQLLDVERAGAQVIQFHAGQAERTLYVPLRKQAGELVADGVRTFRVKLRQVQDGPSPGQVEEVRVTLLE
jgi:serine/threonine protein kinase